MNHFRRVWVLPAGVVTWAAVAAVAAVTAVSGCKSQSAMTGDARAADSPPSDLGSEAASDASDGGAGDLQAPADVGVDARLLDCYPDCIKALRATCERPGVDGGTCVRGGIGEPAACYSNGVREFLVFVPNGDGGMNQVETFTTPDGHTTCYQVVAEPDGLEHFQTTTGQDVALVRPMGAGLDSVTCNGVTTTVDRNDPTCATLNLSYCTGVGCP